VKKCRKLRGYALIESLFHALNKTIRQGLHAFEINMSHEKVKMFKN